MCRARTVSVTGCKLISRHGVHVKQVPQSPESEHSPEGGAACGSWRTTQEEVGHWVTWSSMVLSNFWPTFCFLVVNSHEPAPAPAVRLSPPHSTVVPTTVSFFSSGTREWAGTEVVLCHDPLWTLLTSHFIRKRDYHVAIKIRTLGLMRWLRGQGHWPLFGRPWFWFNSQYWHGSSQMSVGSEALFWLHAHGAHTYVKHTAFFFFLEGGGVWDRFSL